MTNIQYYSGAIDASGCIGNGWELIKKNYWMYFGISILALIMIGCIPIVNMFLLGPVLAGVYYTLLREMRGEDVEFGMMFKKFDRFVPIMAVGLLQSLPGIIYQFISWGMDIARLLSMRGGRMSGEFYQAGNPDLAAGLSALYIVFMLVFLVVSIIWNITFYFALPLLAEHDLGPIEAIKLSAKAGWSNVGGIILLSILEVLIAIAGMLALCVGIFFVFPLIYAATAFAYRQVFPDMTPTVYRDVPPSPDVYGGTYGQGQ